MRRNGRHGACHQIENPHVRELPPQGIAVFLGAVRQMSNKVLDLFPAGFSQGLRPAKVHCIRLHQVGIKLMLSDDLAEASANLGADIVSGS